MYIPGAFLGASPVMPLLDRYLVTALKVMLKRGLVATATMYVPGTSLLPATTYRAVVAAEPST
jgi:hypothetical protein